MKYRYDLSSPVEHYYLGKAKNYKVWQEVQPLSNKLSPGRCRYVLLDKDECTYPQKKWSDELTALFFDKITKICLKFTQSFTDIHYLGKYDETYVWEVWNIYDRSREDALPHLVTFNGSKYRLVEDKNEILSLIDFFLKTYKLSS